MILVIEKEANNVFSLTYDSGEPIRTEQNRLTTVGDFTNFKTANGANLILKQNIFVEEITIIASGTFNYTDINDLWNKLIEIGFFNGVTNSGVGSVIDRFDELSDTFDYFGRDGQVVTVNESQLRLETQPISLFTPADRDKLDGIQAEAEVNVQADASVTDPNNPAYIKNFPNIQDIGADKEDTSNKQNSLTADGTGVKFPTVDAVNSNFNNFNIDKFNQIGVSKSILTSGVWDANIREIGNILRIDKNNLVLVYTGTTIPYTQGVSEFIGLATSNDNGNTWIKGGLSSDGKIINTPSEDPYIVKNPNNNNYHIYCERKNSSLTYKHAGIELFTSTDLINWSSQGIVLDKNLSNAWETTDVSSPAVIIEGNSWKMYYEGRSYTAGTNAGVVCLATSNDGITWTKSTINPLIYGSQWDSNPTVDWAVYLVPDDIVKVKDEFFLTLHAFNGFEFVESILVSSDGVNWKDNLGTYITNQNKNDFSGDGFMFFENKIIWNDINNIYLSKATFNAYGSSVYNDRTNQGEFDEIISNNKNENIYLKITSNSSRILGRNIKSNKGVEKVIFNDSDFLLTIQPADGVLINGISSNVILQKGEVLKLVGTGVNSWQVFENNNLILKTGNQTKSGILTFPSFNGFFMSDRHYIWHRPDLGGMTISTEDVNGSSVFIKDSNGFVGILKNNPSSAFDVNGVISATSYTGDATLTGVPTAPTATAGTNTTQIANTAFVNGNFVTLTGASQAISSQKIFSETVTANGGVDFGNNYIFTSTNTPSTNFSATAFARFGNRLTLINDAKAISFNLDNITSLRTYTMPNLSGTLAIKSDLLYANQTITANKTVVIGDFVNNNELILRVDTTAGNITVTLLAFTVLQGYKVTVIKIDSSANSVLIQGVGGVNIDGASTLVVSGQYGKATVGADLVQYIIL